MPLTKKSQPERKVILTEEEYPLDLPALPEDVVRRFSSIGDWQSRLNDWWGEVLEVFNRLNKKIEDGFNFDTSIASLQDSLTNLRAELDSLQAELDAINLSFLQAQVASMSSSLDSLLDSLQDHIGLTSAHGVEGNVVGTGGEQELDEKTLGLSTPGYGRFSTLIYKSSIDLGESVTIPSGYTMAVAGPFTINGNLIIEGYFKAL